MPDADEPSKMDTRNKRSYTFTFDTPEERLFYIEYAQRVHGLKLAQWLKKMMRDDRRNNEPLPPKS